MIGPLRDLLAAPRRARLRAQALRSLAAMLASGVHLTRALEVLHDQFEDREFRQCFARAGRAILSGQPLSKALAGGPFSILQLQLIKVGERTGALYTILMRLGDQAEQEQSNSLRVFSALTYPCIVLLATILLVLLAQQFVLKGLLEMLGGLGVPLPWPTQLLSFGSRLLNNPWFVALGLLGCLAGLNLLAHFAQPLRAWLYRLPVLGPVLRMSLTIEVLRSLTLCLQAGVPLLSIFSLLSALDPLLEEPLNKIRQGVEEGEPLSALWQNSDFFPPLVAQVMRAGEESGSTADLLVSTARLLEMQLDESLEVASAALQPLVMLLVAALVAFVLVGTLLPLLQVAGGLA